MAILKYFPGQPRKVQTQVLETLERYWAEHDVFVIQAPVATGKTRISRTIANWAQSHGRTTAILTPNNILTTQYVEDDPGMPHIFGRSRYEDDELYLEHREAVQESNYFTANYWCYANHRLFRDVMVVDEAHNLLPMITSGAAITFRQSEYGWPDSIHTAADFLEWIHTTHPLTKTAIRAKEGMELVLKSKGSLHVTAKQKVLGDKLLTVTPLNARHIKHYMFPYSTQKIVLMSATINHNDIYDLALDKKRVCYIPCESPIPPVSRPFVDIGAVSVGYNSGNATVEVLAENIRELLARHGERGLVHCTYGLAQKLRPMLAEESRLIWHNSRNKREQYQKFLATEGAVLVASGMYEGVDLADDKARWQAICKVPYQSLAESSVREKLKFRPESYAWSAIRDVVQASGRICRNPTDFGVTYMLDKNWRGLAATYRHLLPIWFRTAVYNHLDS